MSDERGPSPGLTGVLPLKISGWHYDENRAPFMQGRRAGLQERFRVATRIAAQGLYRLRRALVGSRRRTPRWEHVTSIQGRVEGVAGEAGKR